jgi:N-acetylmuramoyl-L-alanine amidase
MPKGKRTIKKIIIHHSASPVSTTVEDIDRWHKARGWSGIGYHYVCLEDGTIAKGRNINRSGAHTKGFNKDSIGLCVTGNFQDYHCPKPRFDKLMAFVGELIEKHDLSWDHVYYHKQFGNTACCGHFLIEQLKQYLKGRRCQC